MTDWPLTGRDDELRTATAALVAGTAVVVAGDAGVGRTRLLREVLRAWDGPTEWVVATAAGHAVPFGAVAHLRGDHTVVGVDDAHLLDDGSAATLHQLAVRRAIIPIVSIRCGETVSDAVTALWKDGGLRISLAPLPANAIGTLLDHALPGPLDPISRRRVTRLVAGNPLLLREMLADARDTGALVHHDGVYRWRGPAASPRVAELMNTRPRAVNPASRAVLEIIACGEPLAMRLLEQLTEPAAIEAAEGSELAEATRSWILLFDGRCQAALDTAQRVRHDPQAVVWAAMSGAMAAGLLGRPALAAEIAERGRAVAELPWGPAEVGFGACCALWATGQPLPARALADDGHRRAVTSESSYMAAVWAGLRGVVAKAQGHLATARHALREAVALAEDGDPAHVLRPCLAQLAGVSALTGDVHTARQLIARADDLARRDNRLYDAWVELDRAWVHAAEGALSEATDAAARAAKLAMESEQPAFEAVALYDAARLGAAQAVLPRLETLAGQLEGGFVRTLSRAAGALATGDEDELEHAAVAFAGRGHLLLAAELYTAAAHALRHNGKRARARAATGHARALLAGECRGARTPLLDLGGPSAVLTPREREIALLATTLPSRSIAEQLGLSVHTVNNTLAHVYTKLAVRNRHELVLLLGQPGNPR